MNFLSNISTEEAHDLFTFCPRRNHTRYNERDRGKLLLLASMLTVKTTKGVQPRYGVLVSRSLFLTSQKLHGL
jgi:hypothetical protein